MSEKHSFFAYLQRQPPEKLHFILLQELEKPCQTNAALIVYLLYLWQTKVPHFPQDILQAWENYLQAAHESHLI